MKVSFLLLIACAFLAVAEAFRSPRFGPGRRRGRGGFRLGRLLAKLREAMEKQRNAEQAWNNTTDALRTLDGEIPDKLFVVYEPSEQQDPICVAPGDVVFTEDVLEPPTLYYKADPNAYYTYMIEDTGLADDAVYVHYLVVNIQGNDLSTGDVLYCYLPPVSFYPDPSGSGLVHDPEAFHEYLHLIYKQDGPINVDEIPFKDCGCQGLVSRRFNALPHAALEEEPFNMEGPVAGTFMNVPSKDPVTTEFLCELNTVSSPDGNLCGEGVIEFFYPNVEGATTGDLVCDPENPIYLAAQFEDN